MNTVSDALTAELNTRARGTLLLVISETTKQPYKRHHFSHEFARIRKLAGLPEGLQFRDLRRTAATEMVDREQLTMKSGR